MIGILGLIAVVLFVVGIAFLFKGYTHVPDAGSVVGKEDFDKVNKELKGSKEQEGKLKVQMDSLTVELQDTRKKHEQSQKEAQAADALKVKGEEYKAQIQELEKNLELLRTAATSRESKSAEENQKLTDGLNQVLRKIDEVEKEILAARQAVDEESKSADAKRTIQELEQEEARLKKLGEDCLTLEKTLEEQRQSSQALKQHMEENKVKMQLLSEKTMEGAELIAQFAEGKEFEEFRKSIHLDEITRKHEEEIKALKIKNMELEQGKKAGNPSE